MRNDANRKQAALVVRQAVQAVGYAAVLDEMTAMVKESFTAERGAADLLYYIKRAAMVAEGAGL